MKNLNKVLRLILVVGLMVIGLGNGPFAPFSSGGGGGGGEGGVTLQATAPGTPQTGNVNISGAGIFGTLTSKNLGHGGFLTLSDNDDVNSFGYIILKGGLNKHNYIVLTQNNISDGFEITPSTAINGLTFSRPALAINYLSQVGVGGIVAPTAFLHLPAGSATANTGPLKFTAGTLLTQPESGAVEWYADALSITTAAGLRKTIAYTDLNGSMSTGTANIYPSSDGTNNGTKVNYFYVTLTGTGTFLPPPGIWNNGDKLIIVIYTPSAQTVNFTASCWNALGTVKPVITVATKLLYVSCVYNGTIVATYHPAATWDVTGVSQQQ